MDYLEFWGPTLLRSYDELAVMPESGMTPECIPNPWRHCAKNKSAKWLETSIYGLLTWHKTMIDTGDFFSFSGRANRWPYPLAKIYWLCRVYSLSLIWKVIKRLKCLFVRRTSRVKSVIIDRNFGRFGEWASTNFDHCLSVKVCTVSNNKIFCSSNLQERTNLSKDHSGLSSKEY